MAGAAIALNPVLLTAADGAVPASPQDGDFDRWARRSLRPISSLELSAPSKDLQPLRAVIGNKRFVLLGESQHFATEPLAFRNRLFKYLVEDLGFSAIAIESGVTESRVLNNYVLGGPGDLTSALSQGLSWTFDVLPQNAELIRWMRAYNADPRHVRKLQVYGIDVPGSLSNPTATRSADTALNEALRYLDQVDPQAMETIKGRVKPIVPFTRWSVRDYLSFPQSLRDSMTVAVAEVVSFMERRQLDYVARSSRDAYAWGYRQAIAARQVDDWLRRIPAGEGEKDFRNWTHEQLAVRNRAMFENMRWAMGQLEPGAKLLVFAALGHNANSSYLTESDPLPLTPFGAYMKDAYGEQMITIGHTAVAGEIGGCGMSLKSRPMPSTSATVHFSQPKVPLYVLDLRHAPASARWLRESSGLWNGFESTTQVIADSFDVLFFSENLTPACRTAQ
jgi:erythromycin esterase